MFQSPCGDYTLIRVSLSANPFIMAWFQSPCGDYTLISHTRTTLFYSRRLVFQSPCGDYTLIRRGEYETKREITEEFQSPCGDYTLIRKYITGIFKKRKSSCFSPLAGIIPL